MEFTAKHRFAKTSPQKAKLVIDLIRGKNVNEALNTLKFSTKRAAYFVDQLLRSAIANVQNNDQGSAVDVEDLYIADIRADKGPVMKRWYCKAMGRGGRRYKKSCHLSIVLRPEQEFNNED